MEFTVSGKIILGKDERPFSKIVQAQSEKDAKEKAYALFGSTNRLPRNKIKIEKVQKGSS